MKNIDFISRSLPYFATLYYVDILFVLPRITYISGKAVAVTGVFFFMLLWTVHVIALYYRKEINRKIHLVFIEVDFALRLPFIVNFLFFRDHSAYWFEVAFFIINALTLISALAFIYYLTDDRVKPFYG